MTERKRDFSIDFLRGTSIIFIVLIHVISKYREYWLSYAIWDYLHFVVISIVFCSGASMAIAYSKLDDMKGVFAFLKKRFFRITVSWWGFLATYFILFFIIDSIGGKFRHSMVFVMKSIFLFGFDGGLKYGWLLFLILILSFIYPILNISIRKFSYKTTFLWSFLIALLFQAYFFQSLLEVDGTLIFFIPTIFVFFLGMYYSKSEKANLLGYAVIASTLYLILRLVLLVFEKSTVLIDNKYPPNFFYISYAIAITYLLLFFVKKYEIKNNVLKRVVIYSSRNSMWLFLWHFLVLDLFEVFGIFQSPKIQFLWVIEILIVLAICGALIKVQQLVRIPIKNETRNIP